MQTSIKFRMESQFFYSSLTPPLSPSRSPARVNTGYSYSVCVSQRTDQLSTVLYLLDTSNRRPERISTFVPPVTGVHQDEVERCSFSAQGVLYDRSHF